MSSLRELVTAIVEHENALASPLDPAEIVGDIRDKVDAIKAVLDEFESTAKGLKLKAKRLRTTIKAIENNHKRLKEYVRFQMQENHFEKLPGNDYYVRLQNRATRIEFARIPDDIDFIKYSKYVRISRSYSWDEEMVARDLGNGTLETCEFARFVTPNQVRFYLGGANNEQRSKGSTKKRHRNAVDTAAIPDNGGIAASLESGSIDSAGSDGVSAES